MGWGWPYYHWIQTPTVGTHTLNDCHVCPLDTRASVVSHIVLTYQDFHRAKLRKHDSRLIHVVHVLLKNAWSLQYLSDYLKPLYHFIVDVVRVTISI